MIGDAERCGSRPSSIVSTRQGLRLRKSALPRRRDRDQRAATPACAGGLLRLRPPPAGLRHVAGPPLRVCPAVGDRRQPAVRPPPGELPALRGDGRASALGPRQAPPDDRLRRLPGALGPPAELARGGRHLPHQLGERVPRRGLGGRIWPGTPRFERHYGHRRGRSAVPEGPPLPNRRLPDRQRLPPAAVDRPGTYGQDPAALLPQAGPPADRGLAVRLQRHVATLLEGHRQEGQSRPCTSWTVITLSPG